MLFGFVIFPTLYPNFTKMDLISAKQHDFLTFFQEHLRDNLSRTKDNSKKGTSRRSSSLIVLVRKMVRRIRNHLFEVNGEGF